MASGRHGRPRNEPEGLKEVMGTLHKIAVAIREEATATNCMMERME